MEKYLSVNEAAEIMGKTARQVRNLCHAGKIPNAIKIGKSYAIPSDFKLKKNSQETLQEKFEKERGLQGLKYNYIIVHGTFGHPGENWFPWLAEELCKLDLSGRTQKEDILIPHFPSSDCSDYESWKSILMGYIDSGIINKNTIFVCHSLGPLFVSKVLIEEQVKVKGIISVEAAANHLMGNPAFDKINSTFFVPSWEYLENVKKYIDFNYCFYTDNDPHIPYNILLTYVKHAATKSFFIPNAGHFNSMSGYTKFPQLLELIRDIEINLPIQEEKIESLVTNGQWDKELSHQWTNMTWPNRPSVSELAIYTKALRLHEEKNMGRECLVLGSNVEFRDWAYEENLNVSLMNNNEGYHLATYRELRHKKAPYKLILDDWKKLDFEEQFDFIVGDELIGNLETSNIEDFISRVAKSLKKDGLFLSKSFYLLKNYKIKTPKEIFADYYKNGKGSNPLAYCDFDLTMYCLNDKKFVSFKQLDTIIQQSYEQKIITQETYDFLNETGIKNMKFNFFVPYLEEYENIVRKYFNILEKCYTDDVGAKDYPIYILEKK